MDKKTRDNLRNRVRRFKTKLKAIEYKGGKCQDCGQEVHPAAYDFHHLDPTEKDFDPGALMRRTEDVLYAELDKCVLLCANCHRVRHYDDLPEAYVAGTDALLGGDNTVVLTYEGKTQNLKAWADETGIPYSTLQARVKTYGWDISRALTTPVRGQPAKSIKFKGEYYTLPELCAAHRQTVTTIRGRLRLGWSLDRALTTPKRGTRWRGV